jgi:hypothetical protein
MKHIYRLIAEPQAGSTLDATAAELAAIMRECGISHGRVIHNDRRYDVALHPPYAITALDGEPESNR